MIIIPAIDIQDGKCVRLLKGDYDQKKIYYDDPLVPAIEFKKQGARLLHIIDLDGARQGNMVNLDSIKRIKKRSGLEIQVGGGIRSTDVIQELIRHDIKRIIIGTRAIEDHKFIKELEKYKDYIIFSIDVQGDRLKTRGWRKQTDILWTDFLKEVLVQGFDRIIVTDITRDGTLTGVNQKLYSDIHRAFPEMNMIVSGGMSDIDDIKEIIRWNIPSIQGIIVGKAIYENKIKLKEAIQYAG
ncbi:MAG: 1-(5-phosphoribosyl)-5-[(5-phosphoribosylamino)methylideneamino]imidazole-4-carboxamide isomerase [Spirochaetes bacterium]|nr:1-(5-phosphoribosyl)-5-[(5-phosphoribosylamino)methylideneamino]imidazole-4-carboxamide isomerase [Spirochaetota bacterium]